MPNAWAYAAGASGTVTVPAGCVLTHIRAQSQSGAGTVSIFGGTAIPVVGAAAPDTQELVIEFPTASDPNRPGEILGPQSVAGATDIVFTSTVSYFVGYLRR